MAHKNRKMRKKRGSRTCGQGYNKRGAGSRGGTGMGGTLKGKWTWVIKNDPKRFGRRGFDVPAAVKRVVNTLNVGEIEEMASKVAIAGKGESFPGLSREKNKIIVDVTQLDYDKVLGKGKITRPVVVKAKGFTKSAEEKIKGAGGETILTGD
ncbi:MAG: uL15 family ribosomal protein [Candidatus Hydrothermarchaeaceae archaeon]